jgi:hypothetical protein
LNSLYIRTTKQQLWSLNFPSENSLHFVFKFVEYLCFYNFVCVV